MRKMKPSTLWETDVVMGGAFFDLDGLPGSEYLQVLETRDDVLIFRVVDSDGDLWLRVFVVGKCDKEDVRKSIKNTRHPKFALWDPRIRAWKRIDFDKMAPDFFTGKPHI